MSDEIAQALNDYLGTYLCERDLASTLKMLHISASGYGTGFNEKAFNIKEMHDFYTRDLEQVPKSVDFEIYNIHTQLLESSSGYSACEINLKLHIAEQEVKLNHLRLSVFWTKKDKKYKIAHMHLSFPTDAHEEEEAYPIKELEERNAVLQRLVDEKTLHLNKALEKLTLLATIDKLTNIYNRQKTQELLEQETVRANRYKNKLSIVMVDIDFFKEINDTAGHNVGDSILSEFASIMSKNTRATDICGRWGGEEFLIISPESCEADAIKISKKIQAAINSHTFETGIKLTASFGVATFETELSPKDLVKKADDALYYSKRHGRNQICLL